MTPRLHPLWIIAGTALFGLLTFLAGLLVGLSLADKPEEGRTQAAHGTAALGGVAPHPGATAPTTPIPAIDASSAPPTPTATTSPDAASGGPMVKGLRSGAVTDVPGTPLGPLATQALAVQGPGELPLSSRVISVEVARFLLAPAAADLVAQLKKQGFTAETVTASFPGMPPWHVVTLGPLPDEQTAHQLAIEAARATGLAARVVSWPKPAP
ncbi:MULTISPECIES: SPOR domain-containing protein [unclassified Azospirillum]|uniref:SPOR domain-containing protein n=1 Tax=unclassified Azospirillum TaxID=2630922 RepID=UPI000B6D17E5|nr:MULTISPECIES: SPOR domain-containing protein [unclassified Azospirillum]SNS13167.1 Sporulation related domain-containing protein [Azospirillum sp. RU38E]SNS30238.1 Sporulation related domain-containing protein [Azospirillum sp. RU37A]